MKAYIKAFDKMLKVRYEDNMKTKWKDGLEVFDWWVYNNAYISKKRISKYPTECSNCKYLGHKLMCEFYCPNPNISKDFLKEV